MPKSTFAGHPLHPQLVTAPLGLFPFTLVMDVMYLATGERRFARAADLALRGGLMSGAAAGAAGTMDYLEIPSDHAAKPVATLHGGMNAGLLALQALNLGLRRRWPRRDERRLPTLLSALGTASMLVSAWYGGHLVYEHGLRVKGRSPIEDAPELKPPGDALLEGALEATVRGR
jgi:uncharacterized membrane protein